MGSTDVTVASLCTGPGRGLAEEGMEGAALYAVTTPALFLPLFGPGYFTAKSARGPHRKMQLASASALIIFTLLPCPLGPEPQEK